MTEPANDEDLIFNYRRGQHDTPTALQVIMASLRLQHLRKGFNRLTPAAEITLLEEIMHRSGQAGTP